MILLTKSAALVAMQQTLESINLNSVNKFLVSFDACKSVDYDDEKLIALFNDNSLLLATLLDDSDEKKHKLSFKIDYSLDFVEFVNKVVDSYKVFDLCEQLEVLEDLWQTVEDFDSNKELLFDVLLSDYTYSYDIETLVNYCEENANIFEGSLSDYAYELIEDCYDTKNMGNLANYIDYESFGRDMELNSEIQELGYNVYWTNVGDIY